LSAAALSKRKKSRRIKPKNDVMLYINSINKLKTTATIMEAFFKKTGNPQPKAAPATADVDMLEISNKKPKYVPWIEK